MATAGTPGTKGWLARLKHDLIKQATWRARDLVHAGRPEAVSPEPRDVAALARGVLELRDAEGSPATALDVWRALRVELAPGMGALTATDEFEAAVMLAMTRARDATRGVDGRSLLSAVLALDEAFERLASALGQEAAAEAGERPFGESTGCKT